MCCTGQLVRVTNLHTRIHVVSMILELFDSGRRIITALLLSFIVAHYFYPFYPLMAW